MENPQIKIEIFPEKIVIWTLISVVHDGATYTQEVIRRPTMDPDLDLDEKIEMAKHIVSQGGEAGFSHDAVEEAGEFLHHHGIQV